MDARRIALSGLSQGGYWILRALVFKHRIAAGIADPGVMDVSTAFLRHLPPQVIELLDAGDASVFNNAMEEGLKAEGAEVRQYSVRDLVDRTRCPMFIVDPEEEQF